jgi:hypothetical protein
VPQAQILQQQGDTFSPRVWDSAGRERDRSPYFLSSFPDLDPLGPASQTFSDPDTISAMFSDPDTISAMLFGGKYEKKMIKRRKT